MSEGKQHENAILIASGITTVASILFYNDLKLTYIISANVGILSNILISNDHDQEGTTLPELRTAQIFTCWIPNRKIKDYLNDKIIRLIKIFFSPYAMWFKHRSVWTHLPPICTLIRYSYIYFAIWYLFLRNWKFGELTLFLYNHYHNEILIFLMFAAIGDAIHTTLDKWEIYW